MIDWGHVRFEVKEHCQGTPQQYYILRVLNSYGDVIHIHSSKRLDYINKLRKTYEKRY